MDSLLIKTISGIHAEIELPVRVYEPYGTPKYWEKLEKEYEYEARELREFIRDHRSRDSYGLYIIKEYSYSCKFCGHEYPEGFDGIVDCCNEAIDLQQDYIKNLINE